VASEQRGGAWSREGGRRGGGGVGKADGAVGASGRRGSEWENLWEMAFVRPSRRLDPSITAYFYFQSCTCTFYMSYVI
jgi:hypothetical protein